MFFNLRAIWRPEMFHGHGKVRSFFEGWHFKAVDTSRRHRYVVIPGLFLAGDDPEESHAFIQILDGMTAQTTYTRYPVESFWASTDKFDVRIGPNRFTRDYLSLEIDTPERRAHGTLRFIGGAPWPVSLFSPGAMGWYAFMPFMECYHGVVSFDHEIQGTVKIDGRAIDFGDGRGYIGKAWGQAFPQTWIWAQSNHFETPGTCLTASAATVPWGSRAFRGFVAGLQHAGELYRFTTYGGASIERLDLTDTHITWHLAGTVRTRHSSGPHRLEVRAARAEGGRLYSPERAAMVARVVESMAASVEVRLVALAGDGETVVFEGVGECAGLGAVGDMDALAGSDEARRAQTKAG